MSQFKPQLNINLLNAVQFINPYTAFSNETDLVENVTYGISANLPVGILGNQVQSWLTFKGGTYSSLNDGFSITIPTFQILNSTITVKQAKNIVSTKVNGRNGTVKTYMGMDDYQIRVSGTLVDTNGVYPINDANALLTKICTAPISIPISCPYLQQILNINYVVIQSFDIPQEEGHYSLQKFTLDLLSDDNSDSIITTNLKDSVNPYAAS